MKRLKNIPLPVVSILITGFLLLLHVFNASAKDIIPSSKYKTRKVSVKSFQGISTSASVNVVYTPSSGKPEVEIYAPENLLPYIQVEVNSQGILTARMKSPDNNLSVKGPHIKEVRVKAPAVHQFSANSSGDIILKSNLKTSKDVNITAQSSGDITGGKISCRNLTLSASSSGDISIQSATCAQLTASASSSGDIEIESLRATQVKAEASSSGDIELSGTGSKAIYTSSSGGEIDAENLKVEQVEASASSGGNVNCHALLSLHIHKASQGGEVKYKGNPEITGNIQGVVKD